MASYIQRQQQGQVQAPVAPAPAAPVHDINQGGGFGGGGDPSGLLSAGDQPRSNNPLNDVANFGGANSLPGGGKVSANSTSTGSPFQPTFADPAAAAALMAGLSNYHYSVPAGGYLHNDYPSGPLGGGHNEYYIGESHMTGSDPNANKAVGDIYGQLGALPMVQGQSGALAKLQPGGGGAAPSMNDRLASAGVQGPWGGPWEFPGWHLDDTHHGRY